MPHGLLVAPLKMLLAPACKLMDVAVPRGIPPPPLLCRRGDLHGAAFSFPQSGLWVLPWPSPPLQQGSDSGISVPGV